MSQPIEFELVPWETADQDELERYADRTLYQTRPWIEFVMRTQRAQPALVALQRGSQVVGHFTFLTVKRGGFRIAGSPFRGWTTSYMGFNAHDENVRDEALRGIGAFLFKRTGCVHLELMDRHLDIDRARAAQLDFRPFQTYEIDLAVSETELLRRMHTSVRRYIGRAERQRNVLIEECRDAGFAEDYYRQLQEVFARDGLVPTYGIDRVRSLLDCLLPTGNLLLLRARNRSGRCIATGIFPAGHGTMYFWGGASLTTSHAEHPNEPLQWHAMRYWKARGVTCYDMGGGGQYKTKYGGIARKRPWIRQSRSRWVAVLRDFAYRAFGAAQRVRGWRVGWHRSAYSGC